MTKRIFLLAVFSAVAILAVGCRCDSRPLKITTMPVERIMMHESGHFTFLVPKEGGKKAQLEIRASYTYDTANGVTIVSDVPEGQQMRVEFTCKCGDKEVTCKDIPKDFNNWRIGGAYRLTIHTHSVSDFDGGGWNHGKHGAGQTTVLQ